MSIRSEINLGTLSELKIHAVFLADEDAQEVCRMSDDEVLGEFQCIKPESLAASAGRQHPEPSGHRRLLSVEQLLWTVRALADPDAQEISKMSAVQVDREYEQIDRRCVEPLLHRRPIGSGWMPDVLRMLKRAFVLNEAALNFAFGAVCAVGLILIAAAAMGGLGIPSPPRSGEQLPVGVYEVASTDTALNNRKTGAITLPSADEFWGDLKVAFGREFLTGSNFASVAQSRGATNVAVAPSQELHTDQEISQLTEAIQSKQPGAKDLASLYYRRGLAFARSKQFGRAILDYSTALWDTEAPPDLRLELLKERGVAFASIGDFESSKRDYDLSRELASRHSNQATAFSIESSKGVSPYALPGLSEPSSQRYADASHSLRVGGLASAAATTETASAVREVLVFFKQKNCKISADVDRQLSEAASVALAGAAVTVRVIGLLDSNSAYVKCRKKAIVAYLIQRGLPEKTISAAPSHAASSFVINISR